MSSDTQGEHYWDELFRITLKNSFIATKKVISNKMKKNETLQELSRIAYEFYDIFSKSPIPVSPPTPELYYQDEFVSTSITLSAGCFMVPYFFYELLRESILLDFDYEFSQDVPWDILIGIINQKWLKARKKLTKTDVLICKTLSRYNLIGQMRTFPLSNELIVNRTRQSISSVTNSYASLFTRLIARDFFLINPWKLGWKISLISYSSDNDDLLKVYDSITLSKEFLFDNTIFRIIQYPNLGGEEKLRPLLDLLTKMQGKYNVINKTVFHWNISGLQPREDKSFLEIPQFFSDPLKKIDPNVVFQGDVNFLDWLQNITTGEQEKLFSERRKKFILQDNDESIINLRKERIIKIINFILKHGITLKSLEATANSLSIPIHEFSNLLHYLIKCEVIALGHRFKFIGAGMEYSFLIRNGSKEDYENIQQSLLNCCFSYFYISDGILAGRCQVPDTWVSSFLEFFMRLRLSNIELGISLGQRLLGYSYFNPNIKMPTNLILNEFGLKEIITESQLRY